MGSLYWQLNDCWPGASWSGYDYFGRYKALHYYAKRFYAPVTLGLFVKNNRIRINVSNEQIEGFEGVVSVELCSNDMSVIREFAENIKLDKLSSTDMTDTELVPNDEYSEYVCVTLSDKNGNIVCTRTEFFVKPKHFSYIKPDIKVRFEKATDTEAAAIVTSDVYAGDVYIDFENYDIILSDNYFDITHEGEYRVKFETTLSVAELESSVKVKSAYDIGHN